MKNRYNPDENRYMRKPDNPNYLRRAFHHDYTRPARYLITLSKNPSIPRFCNISGADINFPIVALTPTARFFEEALSAWLSKNQQIEVANHVVMPDHIHLCVIVKDILPNGLSRAVANLMGMTSSLRHKALPDRFRQHGLQPVFSKGFNDRIAYTQEQWERQIAYTTDNPKRYLMKLQSPDYLIRRYKITIDGIGYIALGNIFLLDAPHVFQAKYHRRYTPDEALEFSRQSRMLIDNGAVPVSPYIHPKEKEIRDYAIDPGYSYIRICENGWLERQYPQGKEFQLISTGRLLLISPLEHESRRKEMKYSRATSLNQLAARIAMLCSPGINIPIYQYH